MTIRSWRLLVQFAAFLLILLNPFLNFYYEINFIQGWYQSIAIGDLWFVSPLEGLESILVSKTIYLPLLVAMLIPVLVALILGRVFCGWICPIHFLSELSDRLLKFVSRKKYLKDHFLLPREILWFALIGELLLAMILGTPLFVFLSPPGLVGREIMMVVFFKTLALEGVVVLAVLFVNLITRRFFCRYLCPLGALLALIGMVRRLRIVKLDEQCTDCGLCSRSCPLGLNPAQAEAESPYCWNCGECVTTCKHDALAFRWLPMASSHVAETVKQKKQTEKSEKTLSTDET
jgi:ferredoxin-type protein NapH